MDFRGVPKERLLLLSSYWLTNRDARQALASHELGSAMLRQLEAVHLDLSELFKRREEVQSSIDRLTRLLESLSGVYDDHARAVSYALELLILVTTDPDARAWYQRLHGRLYPDGLGFINGSYADKAGLAVLLERMLTADDWARMAAVPMERHSLAELCRRWLDAGMALGRHLIERERLRESATGDGAQTSKLHSRKVRRRWVQVVNIMIDACELMDLSDEQRKALLSPLERLQMQPRRQGNNADRPGDDDGEPDEPPDVPVDEAPETMREADAVQSSGTGRGSSGPDMHPTREDDRTEQAARRPPATSGV